MIGYNQSVQRQLFEIHNVLSVDRPFLQRPLLNSEMLCFARKIIISFLFYLFKWN
jgi:hypothetical protein